MNEPECFRRESRLFHDVAGETNEFRRKLVDGADDIRCVSHVAFVVKVGEMDKAAIPTAARQLEVSDTERGRLDEPRVGPERRRHRQRGQAEELPPCDLAHSTKFQEAFSILAVRFLIRREVPCPYPIFRRSVLRDVGGSRSTWLAIILECADMSALSQEATCRLSQSGNMLPQSKVEATQTPSQVQSEPRRIRNPRHGRLEVCATELVGINQKPQKLLSLIGKMSAGTPAGDLASRQIRRIDCGLFQVGKLRAFHPFPVWLDLQWHAGAIK